MPQSHGTPQKPPHFSPQSQQFSQQVAWQAPQAPPPPSDSGGGFGGSAFGQAPAFPSGMRHLAAGRNAVLLLTACPCCNICAGHCRPSRLVLGWSFVFWIKMAAGVGYKRC